MAKIGIFRDGLYPSGGIETWLFNIAKRWGKTHDITIYYDNADDKQPGFDSTRWINTLSEYTYFSHRTFSLVSSLCRG